MTTDPLEQFSEALADRLAAASRFIVVRSAPGAATAAASCGATMWW